MTSVQTTVLLQTKPLLDDDSGFRHGLETEKSLALTQCSPEVSHLTTRLVDLSLHCVNAISILMHLESIMDIFTHTHTHTHPRHTYIYSNDNYLVSQELTCYSFA